MPRIGAISRQLFMTFPRTCIRVVAPCTRTSNLLLASLLYFSAPLYKILSRGIAKRVTPPRRCESIRSLDRHRG